MRSLRLVYAVTFCQFAASFGAAYATPAVLCLCGAVLLAVIGRVPVDAPA